MNGSPINKNKTIALFKHLWTAVLQGIRGIQFKEDEILNCVLTNMSYIGGPQDAITQPRKVPPRQMTKYKWYLNNVDIILKFYVEIINPIVTNVAKANKCRDSPILWKGHVHASLNLYNGIQFPFLKHTQNYCSKEQKATRTQTQKEANKLV
jgi:hypothetical protein